MKTADFKFLVLAVLCVLLVFPIFGYVQRQAALRPDPRLNSDALRDRARSQRQALHDWLEFTFAGTVVAVTTAPGDPHIVNVAVRPGVTHAQALAIAGHVQQIMTTYFHEGKSGSVTVVTLLRDHGHDKITIVTGLPEQGPNPVSAWHIFSGHTEIQ